MSVCVGIHCASAVSVEASPPSLSRCDFISAGVSPEELGCSAGVYPYSFEVRSMTADRKDVLWDVLPLSFALLWAPASSFCLALCTQLVCGCRGLLELTGLAGTGGRTKGLGLGLGLIPGFLALVSDPGPEWRKLTLAAEEFPCEAEGLIWLMISQFPWRNIQLGISVPSSVDCDSCPGFDSQWRAVAWAVQ